MIFLEFSTLARFPTQKFNMLNPKIWVVLVRYSLLFSCQVNSWGTSLPTTNMFIAPENWWVWNITLILGNPIFRCELLVSGRVVFMNFAMITSRGPRCHRSCIDVWTQGHQPQQFGIGRLEEASERAWGIFPLITKNFR